MIDYAPTRVFPMDLSFDDMMTSLEEIRVSEVKGIKLYEKKSPLDKRVSINLEKKKSFDASTTLAYFALCICSRASIKSKQFIQETLIVMNLLYHTLLKKGKHFLLRRSTEEKVDMEDNSKASKPISPVLVLSNMFVAELFPVYLSKITW